MKALSTLNSKYLITFLYRAISAILIVSFLLNSVFYLFTNNFSQAKLVLFNKSRHDFSGLAIGTSHSVGFHFPSLGIKGVNFYDGGGDIEEVVFKSAVIMDKAINIRNIFIPVSPGSLHMSQRHIAVDYYARRLIVVKNLPFSFSVFLTAPLIVLRSILDSAFPFLEIRRVALSKIRPSKVDEKCKKNTKENSNKDELILGAYMLKKSLPTCLSRYASMTAIKHSSYIDVSVKNEPDIERLNVDRLLTLADSLVEIEGRVLLVVPPLTKEYYQHKNIQKWVPKHNELLNTLSNHPNIEVYDFHDFFYDEMEDGSNDYFYDDDHLALPGAIKFSQALKKAMDEREGR